MGITTWLSTYTPTVVYAVVAVMLKGDISRIGLWNETANYSVTPPLMVNGWNPELKFLQPFDTQ